MCADNAPPVDAVVAGGAGAILTGRLRSGRVAPTDAPPPAFCRRVRVRGDFTAFGLPVGVVGVVDVGDVCDWPGDGAAIAWWCWTVVLLLPTVCCGCCAFVEMALECGWFGGFDLLPGAAVGVTDRRSRSAMASSMARSSCEFSLRLLHGNDGARVALDKRIS